jgi:hypothetical protein
MSDRAVYAAIWQEQEAFDDDDLREQNMFKLNCMTAYECGI